MTGPEHYRVAERMLAKAEADGEKMSVEHQQTLVSLAQAHATLALAAATAEPIAVKYDGDYDTAIPAAWSEAIS